MKKLFYVALIFSSSAIAEVKNYSCPSVINVEQKVIPSENNTEFSSLGTSGLHRLENADIRLIKKEPHEFHKGMASLRYRTIGTLPEEIEREGESILRYSKGDFSGGGFVFLCSYEDTSATFSVPVDPMDKCDIKIIDADPKNSKLEPTITLTCEK
jgi:hypothetical protein